MTNRFEKAKKQLLSNEKVIEKERLELKKCGKKLPEEIIKLPKIGEWNLSQNSDIQIPVNKTKGSPNKKRFKPFPNSIPLTPEQKDRIQNAPNLSQTLNNQANKNNPSKDDEVVNPNLPGGLTRKK